jgi:hypothetical protein
MKESVDLNFTCNPGDMILVRSRALRCGENKLQLETVNEGWNQLAKNDYFLWSYIGDDHLTQCLVIGKCVFPEEAKILNYLSLLTEQGQIAYVFDDPQNGFWIPIDGGSGDINPKEEMHPHARGVNASARKLGSVGDDASTCAWIKHICSGAQKIAIARYI